MRLYIVRHAWADQRDEQKWPDDRLRPLSDDGRKRFDQMVKKMVKADWMPALVATSPLVRCRQTADLIAQRVKTQPEVVELEALAPGSDLERLVAWSAGQIEPLAWVGHAPDVGQLAAQLIGDGSNGLEFAKGAIACICFEGQVASGNGKLEWLVTARVLNC